MLGDRTCVRRCVRVDARFGRALTGAIVCCVVPEQRESLGELKSAENRERSPKEMVGIEILQKGRQIHVCACVCVCVPVSLSSCMRIACVCESVKERRLHGAFVDGSKDVWTSVA